jgi:hypothetical protein
MIIGIKLLVITTISAASIPNTIALIICRHTSKVLANQNINNYFVVQ